MKRAFLVVAWLSLPAFGAALSFGCGGGSSDSSTGSGGGGGCGSKLKEAKNSEFCQGTPGNLDCKEVAGLPNQECKVPLPEPSGDLQRSANVKEFAGMGAPQVDCFAPAGYPAPPAPAGMRPLVTAKGVAKVFSSGCDSSNLTITFYTVKRDGGPEDGKLDQPVGTAFTTLADCKATGTATPNDKCGMRYECPYNYPNVPSQTELAIKTEGAGKWAPLIQYNIYIPPNEVVGGEWTHDVRALAQDDYAVIPAVAIGGPVTAGNGVVAGEVHDCGDVRLINAVADVDKPRVNRTYFTSNEDNPLPDTKATGTSSLGLYAAFDISPGQVTVAAIGKVGGVDTALGQHHVWVYADSVTSVTFKGLEPYQLPK